MLSKFHISIPSFPFVEQSRFTSACCQCDHPPFCMDSFKHDYSSFWNSFNSTSVLIWSPLNIPQSLPQRETQQNTGIHIIIFNIRCPQNSPRTIPPAKIFSKTWRLRTWASGTAFVASGTVFAKVVLPKGVNIGLEVFRIFSRCVSAPMVRHLKAHMTYQWGLTLWRNMRLSRCQVYLIHFLHVPSDVFGLID